MKKLKDGELVKLESKAIMVDSAFYGITYGIDLNGKGMWILFPDGKEIAIAAENIEPFLKEVQNVWSIFKD